LTGRAPLALGATREPSNVARAEARAAFVARLDDGAPLRYDAMRSAPLYKRDRLNSLLERAGDRDLGARAALLGRILTVELALRTVDAGVDWAPRLTAREGSRAARAGEPGSHAPRAVAG